MTAPTPRPVAADSVYVWRGFRAAGSSASDFSAFLGSVFVPACALLQPQVGLCAYLPCLVPEDGKPGGAPDQTALMFWADPGAHDRAARAIAVRIYQHLHGDAYDMVRSHTPEVPTSFDSGTGLTRDQPVHLLDGPADWMLGSTRHVVGARPDGVTAPDFLTSIGAYGASVCSAAPSGVDAALLVAGDDYAAVWIHDPRDGVDLSAAVVGFLAHVEPILDTEPARVSLGGQLWDDWPGLDLTAQPCLNIQFDRPDGASPHAQP